MKKAILRGAIQTVALLGLTALAPFAAQAATPPPAYALTVFPTFGGGVNFSYGVNASGQVTGQSYTTDDVYYHGFLATAQVDRSYATYDTGRLGGDFAVGFGVNASGQVAGLSYLIHDTGYHEPLYDHAFLSGPSSLTPGQVGAPGKLKDLGTLGGLQSEAFGLNDAGQVTGYAEIATRAHRAFLSDANGGTLHDLGTLGGTSSVGRSVNAAGEVIGESTLVGGATHAFISGANGGPLKDLGTLGGTTSFAHGINASGQVAGNATTADGSSHAFLSALNGGVLRDLGTLGGTTSSALGVNDFGQVVGSATLANGETHAFLFSNGVMTDLNSLLGPGFLGTGYLLSATGISNTGYIVGYTYGAPDHTRAFLLTSNAPAVPEASSIVSLGLLLSLGGFAIAARRKKSGVRP